PYPALAEGFPVHADDPPGGTQGGPTERRPLPGVGGGEQCQQRDVLSLQPQCWGNLIRRAPAVGPASDEVGTSGLDLADCLHMLRRYLVEGEWRLQRLDRRGQAQKRLLESQAVRHTAETRNRIG